MNAWSKNHLLIRNRVIVSRTFKYKMQETGSTKQAVEKNPDDKNS